MFLSIAIPAGVMFVDVQVGVLLLLVGSYVSYQVVRSAVRESQSPLSEAEAGKLERHSIERGRVIRVQLVDQYGRDLPPSVAQQRMDEARARSGPRDTVVGVRFVLPAEDEPDQP